MKIPRMKQVLLSLSLLTLAQTSFGGGESEALIPKLHSEGPSISVLQQTYAQAADELAKIEQLNRSGYFGLAKIKAIDLFDRINLVHPFVKVIPKIPSEGIITESNTHINYEFLNPITQVEVAMTVANYKGGAFINLLNLAKRTRLQYLIAFFNEQRKSLRNRDIQYIKDELIKIHNIALMIKDKNAPNAFLLFDVDVANPDKQYDFNRELLEFAMNRRELKLTEGEFESLLAEDRRKRLEVYHNQIGGYTNNSGYIVESKPVKSNLSAYYFAQCIEKMRVDGGQTQKNALDFCNGRFAENYYDVGRCLNTLVFEAKMDREDAYNECITRK